MKQTKRGATDPLLRLASRERFADCVARPDHLVDLSQATLWLAAEEYPGLDLQVYLARLESLADRVKAMHGRRPGSLAALNALRGVLVHEEGFTGNTDDYYDPRNSFLNEVLDRKTGIPITLSIVYLEVARRAGIPLEGVNLPGHFVVRLVDRAGSLLVDPFHRGEVLTADQCAARLRLVRGEDVTLTAEHLVAAGPKQILVRMLNNLRLIYLDKKEYARTLAVVERIALITGETPQIQRDRGLLYAKLQIYGKAWASLAASLERTVASDDHTSDELMLALQKQLDRVRHLAAAPN